MELKSRANQYQRKQTKELLSADEDRMRIQQEILKKFLKAGKAKEADVILEDSLAPNKKTDETAEFGGTASMTSESLN